MGMIIKIKVLTFTSILTPLVILDMVMMKKYVSWIMYDLCIMCIIRLFIFKVTSICLYCLYVYFYFTNHPVSRDSMLCTLKYLM